MQKVDEKATKAIENYLPRRRQNPVRLLAWLTRPWLAISLGLHGLLLLLPLFPNPLPNPPEPLTDAEPDSTTPVQVVKLPPAGVQPKIQTSPTAQSPVAQLPQPPVVRPPSAAPPARLPQSRRQVPPVLPSPIASASSPALSPAPSTIPAAVASPSPSPVPDLVSSTPSPVLPSSSPEPLENFPHIANAEAGCNNSKQCWQTADTQWRAISATIQQQLEAQGYALEPVPLADETGRRVYRVSKADEAPYFLNFISTGQGTVYLITQEPMTPAAMQQIAGF